MSEEKNRVEASRWLATGNEDLATAKILLQAGRYAHACFHSQQAGEMAVKAVCYMLGADPWGHSVSRLITQLKGIDSSTFNALQDQFEDAARLDRYYIPTRYPNGLPDITPDQAFFAEDAVGAIRIAEILLERAGQILGNK
jgi:HEPN domain-containing protein